MRFISIVIFALFIIACAKDPEMQSKNQGNLDPIHERGGSDIATLKEQAEQNILTSDVKLLYILTNNFRFYDYARLNTYKSGLIKIELFKYGQTIGSIRIKENKMCILTECSYSWPISKKFFGPVSYGDLFKDIIFRKPIFGGKGTQVGPNGVVIQRFQENGQIIYYEKNNIHSLFKNLSTGVVIAIDDYDLMDGDSGVNNSIAIPQ